MRLNQILSVSLLLGISIFAIPSVSHAEESAASVAVPAASEQKSDTISYDIGGGTTIALPKSWEFKSFFMPPDLKATNIRIFAPGVKIAITGMLETGAIRATDTLLPILEDATKPYVTASVEKEYQAQTFETAAMHGVMAKYTAADKSAGLRALANEISLMVASAVLSKEGSTFSLTISLNKNNKEAMANFETAMAAVKLIN